MKDLIELFEKFKQEGTLSTKPRNIIDTIFFFLSYTCPILQATDFFSYTIFSKYEHNKKGRYDQIVHKIYYEYKI
jgi:hypothetical protein